MTKRSIVISKKDHIELKLLSAKHDKFIYQLINECIPILKIKYDEHNNA